MKNFLPDGCVSAYELVQMPVKALQKQETEESEMTYALIIVASLILAAGFASYNMKLKTASEQQETAK